MRGGQGGGRCCTSYANVADFSKSHAGQRRDHIRTHTHTSVRNVRVFKKIGGKEEGGGGVRKHKRVTSLVVLTL